MNRDRLRARHSWRPGRRYDPDLHSPSDEQSPECALWRAVLRQAWHDAFLATNRALGGSETSTDYDRAEARRWLIAGFGEYVEDRQFVCDAAGIDAEVVCAAARRRISQERAELERRARNAAKMSRHRRRRRLESDLDRLLASEADMAAEDLDAALAELAEMELAA